MAYSYKLVPLGEVRNDPRYDEWVRQGRIRALGACCSSCAHGGPCASGTYADYHHPNRPLSVGEGELGGFLVTMGAIAIGALLLPTILGKKRRA